MFPSAAGFTHLQAERGRSDFDVGPYLLGELHLAAGLFTHILLKDWQFSAARRRYRRALYAENGQLRRHAGGAARPDRLAKGTLQSPSPDAWFDRTVFPAVAVGPFDSAIRDAMFWTGRRFQHQRGLVAALPVRRYQGLAVPLRDLQPGQSRELQPAETHVDILNGATISAAKNLA